MGFSSLDLGAAAGAGAGGAGDEPPRQAMTREMEAMNSRTTTVTASHSPLIIVPSSAKGSWNCVWKNSMITLSRG